MSVAIKLELDFPFAIRLLPQRNQVCLEFTSLTLLLSVLEGLGEVKQGGFSKFS